ncbi:hypothetical protein BB389_03815 [Helicobacter pylori]|nr:hypothetical protein BB389_03815 [Helicobacter pylori]
MGIGKKKDQTPKKKEDLREGVQKKKDFSLKSPKKIKGSKTKKVQKRFQKKPLKKRSPQKNKEFKNKGIQNKEFKRKASKKKPLKKGVSQRVFSF